MRQFTVVGVIKKIRMESATWVDSHCISVWIICVINTSKGELINDHNRLRIFSFTHIYTIFFGGREKKNNKSSTMDINLERDGGVIGTLFQQIINDMKVSKDK